MAASGARASPRPGRSCLHAPHTHDQRTMVGRVGLADVAEGCSWLACASHGSLGRLHGTSTTDACRPAARPPASARPGSGGAARAPPKPVAPLSVERRVVAGSPREPGMSRPLSCQLLAPDRCSICCPGCTLGRGRQWQALAGACGRSYIALRTTVLHYTERGAATGGH